MKYRAEFRNQAGEVVFVEVELYPEEVASVLTAELRGKEEAAVLGYSYGQRHAYSAAPAGYSLHHAERCE